MSAPDAADLFLEAAKLADPERYARLEEQYPLSSEHDNFRAKHGETRAAALRRIGPSGGVPRHMRRRLTDEDRRLLREGVREWQLDYALAKEQAQGAN